MKSSTSRSLAPRASCSRIWLRRSTARPALESASVWFWHTRQRSSVATCITRLSRIGSSAARTATESPAAMKTANTLFAIEFIHQWNELLFHELARDRADALVDDVGFRHAVHAVVDADPAVEVERREPVRIAEALQPRECVIALVLVV